MSSVAQPYPWWHSMSYFQFLIYVKLCQPFVVFRLLQRRGLISRIEREPERKNNEEKNSRNFKFRKRTIGDEHLHLTFHFFLEKRSLSNFCIFARVYFCIYYMYSFIRYFRKKKFFLLMEMFKCQANFLVSFLFQSQLETTSGTWEAQETRKKGDKEKWQHLKEKRKKEKEELQERWVERRRKYIFGPDGQAYIIL